MTLRDWRTGELNLMLAALIVAVGAISSVGLLADRMRLALERDGAQLLGADLVLVSDGPVSQATRDVATELHLQMADVVQFPSMVVAERGEQILTQLASVKAVSEGYPLRGAVYLRYPPTPEAEVGVDGDYLATGVPSRGEVWLDPRLLPELGVTVGDRISLGDAEFVVDNVITVETDRGTNFVNLAPRVMMHHDDLEATGLITDGSRVSYHLLAAGAYDAVKAYEQWVLTHKSPGQRLQTLETGRPEMRRTLDRAQQFLSLVAMLAVLIAAGAIALSARRYMVRHLSSVAVMRCLGATQRFITRTLVAEFVLVALVGAVGGLGVGFLGHLLLLKVLSGYLGLELPTASWLPAFQAVVVGGWLLLGFVLPALAPLRLVSPVRVLRHDPDIPATRAMLGDGVGLLGFVGLLVWMASDLRMGITAAAGFLLAFAVFAALAWIALAALARLRNNTLRSVAWRFALAGLVRRRSATVVQVCALAIGIMALLLLTIIRTDLIEGWRLAAPPDAPNRFLINIQADQYEAVQQHLATADINATLYPIVRGRLVAVNGAELDSSMYENRRARRFIDRESNLSYAAQLPPNNRILQGRWFEPGELAVSLDVELATALGVSVGDVLTWEVAGERVDVQVSNLRQPNWDSMSVNFFVVMSPEALQRAPATWLTSFHIADDGADPLPQLVAQYPNLSVFDISSIVRQVQRVLDQVVIAIQGLFVFTLIAGVLVLYAALAATRDERLREAALLRALGATRQQLERSQWLELGLIGALSGALATMASMAVAWALARFVFDFSLSIGAWVWVAGVGTSVLAAWLGGYAGLRGIVKVPPIRSLREV